MKKLLILGILSLMVGLTSYRTGFYCRWINSWDSCRKIPGCSTIHFFVKADHEGPIWECRSKYSR